MLSLILQSELSSCFTHHSSKIPVKYDLKHNLTVGVAASISCPQLAHLIAFTLFLSATAEPDSDVVFDGVCSTFIINTCSLELAQKKFPIIWVLNQETTL